MGNSQVLPLLFMEPILSAVCWQDGLSRFLDVSYDVFIMGNTHTYCYNTVHKYFNMSMDTKKHFRGLRL